MMEEAVAIFSTAHAHCTAKGLKQLDQKGGSSSAPSVKRNLRLSFHLLNRRSTIDAQARAPVYCISRGAFPIGAATRRPAGS